jgi:hypothetical protein
MPGCERYVSSRSSSTPFIGRELTIGLCDVVQGILLSIASLAALLEPHRRFILDAHLLPPILQSLSHPLVGVRAAACHCLRGLSRSVNVLRTDLVDQGAEEKLVWLLREEENEVVKVTASAAVANLLLEFSPMRNVRSLRLAFVPLSSSEEIDPPTRCL